MRDSRNLARIFSCIAKKERWAWRSFGFGMRTRESECGGAWEGGRLLSNFYTLAKRWLLPSSVFPLIRLAEELNGCSGGGGGKGNRDLEGASLAVMEEGKLARRIALIRGVAAEGKARRSGGQFNRKFFSLNCGLKNGLRFHFDSERCLNYPFLNICFVLGISSRNSGGF